MTVPGRPMAITLLSPKGPLYRHRGGIFRQTLRYMPLTLPTLAALVPPEIPAKVTCIDEGIAEIDPDRVEADLVGITVITGSAPRAYEISARLRARGIAVVLGGPHPTLVPDDAQPHADAVVTGYAEETWPALLRDFAAGTLRPRYAQAPDFRLGGYPLPDRSVLPRRRYVTADVFEATRGCVHDCDFCVVPSAWGRKPLQKPVEEVVADISARRARRAVFVDLNLIADREYARRLFSALTPLKIEWYGLATVLLADDEPLLDLAARSGCRGLLMGFESISREALRRSRKAFNDPDRYARVVRRLHDRGIGLQACFVFGMDDDDAGVFRRTTDFAIETKIDLPRYAIVTPFPGTTLFARLESEGRILHRDWSRYDGQHVVFRPKRLTVEELQSGHQDAWRRTYSWPAIVRRLHGTSAPWLSAAVTNLGYRYYARRLHRFYTCDWMLGRPRSPEFAA